MQRGLWAWPWVQLSGRRMHRYMYGTSLSGTLPQSVGDMKALEYLCVCPLSSVALLTGRVGPVRWGWLQIAYGKALYGGYWEAQAYTACLAWAVSSVCLTP